MKNLRLFWLSFLRDKGDIMQDIHGYSQAITKLRKFFAEKKGFVEVPVQSRLSILAACEDPNTITKFSFSKTEYPLPQTGQMWLEYELLKNPDVNGLFCISTSYRDEPNPIEGRHDKVFPMFEFESFGGMDKLRELEFELLEFLGFGSPVVKNYEDVCSDFNVDIIEAPQETRMQKEYGNCISLENFPLRTHPFWNMKYAGDNLFNKIDIILYGMETIGSAERSTNVNEMREHFLSISDGQYAKVLFDKFGRKRVMHELEDYFALAMVERFGAGIGVTRMVRALKLLQEEKAKATTSNRVVEIV